MSLTQGPDKKTDEQGNRWWAIDPASDRPARVARGREAFVAGGMKGAAVIGTVGVVTHVTAHLRSPFYRNRFYLPGKVFVISSTFVAGWWVFGEHEFRNFIEQQAAVDDVSRRQERQDRGVRFVGRATADQGRLQAAPVPTSEPVAPVAPGERS